jgi:hypothetical protein
MLRRVLVLALAPALALGAPKHHTPPKKTTTPKPETGSGSDARPADAPADPGDKTGSAAPPPSPAPATPASAPATPAPAAPAAQEPQPAANEPDVDSLRQEYLALRDELFKSRARANAVASTLYSTRIQIRFSWTSARYYGVTKASVRLDGAQVYEDTAGAIGGDDGVRFDGFIAPGRHLVTFHVEATGKDDDSFTSTTESQIVVKAVANKDLTVAAKARDGGDIAYQWKRSEHGSYGLGIDVAVKSVAHAEDKGDKK